jgi:hypothetical protein
MFVVCYFLYLIIIDYIHVCPRCHPPTHPTIATHATHAFTLHQPAQHTKYITCVGETVAQMASVFSFNAEICVCVCVCVTYPSQTRASLPSVYCHVNVCVYMCIYKYTCMYVNMYELCEYVYVCKYAYMRIGIQGCVYTNIRLYPRTYVHGARIYVCIHVHTYMFGYVSVCKHT